MVDSVDAALAQAATAAERGADLVEFRVDRMPDPARVAELVTRSPLPCILTCRPTWEGGEYAGEDGPRLDVFAAALAQPRPPAYLDVELVAYERDEAFADRIHAMLHASPDTGLILSSHDFKTRPPDLLQRGDAMRQATACRVIKLAWRARSLRDNLEAMELPGMFAQPTIALCMGEFGLPSRVLAGKCGAFLTFAGLDDQTVTAPGQVGVATLKSLYRWDKVGPQTSVYGVVGWPVGHSLSPHLHNAGFDATGYDGVYLPMPVPPEYEHFKATLSAWLDEPGLRFQGASVTVPHKENLLRFVREMGGEVEPLAARIGAANTLTVRGDGKPYASNTDYAAALHAVCDAMGITPDGLTGRRVAVIGAGGAARAVVAAFATHGASVVIYNRTLEKAEQLAALCEGLPGKVVAAGMGHLCKSCCEVFINCTPIGMHPNVDETPIPDWPKVTDRTVVFDTIYNPLQTRLLREARAAGCTVISGVEMFTRQAAAQFEQWTGQPAPRELFERVVREKLAGG